MPITSSAKKALRSSQSKRVFNLRKKVSMTDAIKEARKVAGAKDKKKAAEALGSAYQAIDKAAKTGVIKKNTAARKKARLSAFIKKATA